MDVRLLGERFRDALAYAAELHRTQVRKGTDIPYVAHLLAVVAIVLEYGGDEEQAIAALLHDAVEDQGGDRVRQEIRAQFGDRVASIVDECTDTDEEPKPPWKARKQTYVAHLGSASEDALLVSMADKLHNTTAIVRDHRCVGATVFDRFQADPEEVAWYYSALLDAYEKRQPKGEASCLLAELRLAVGELVRVAAEA